jgi:tight adherence protein C
MDAMFELVIGMFGDSAAPAVGVFVFLAAGILAFSVMTLVRTRGAVKRRAAGITVSYGGEPAAGGRTLRDSSVKAAKKLLDYTSRHYPSVDNDQMKVLRRRMVQAGIYDPRAVAYFFAIRTILAVACAAAVFVLIPMLTARDGKIIWLFVCVAGVGGYVAPSMYLDKRIKARTVEHRAGFPDLMDLLVVCADSGLSMEAALERVSRELTETYPSLSANIHMANLEIRAGRTLTEALEHLAERLALDEARSFATLIQQSTELGSSITDALRVYSDDMRHKRLSRAEEKAYSLPVKLSLPMMVCIFPVLFVVILLPVIVRVTLGRF